MEKEKTGSKIINRLKRNRWIHLFRHQMLRKKNPVAYAKKIGVNFPEGELHLYGGGVLGDRTMDYYIRKKCAYNRWCAFYYS